MTVKDPAGCTKDLAVIIIQLNNTVTATLSSKTDVPCSGGNTGSVTVAGGGGVAPYTYKIGNGQYQSSGVFTGLAAGNYTVTVRDAGNCTRELAVIVGQLNNTVTATVSSKTDVPCSGGNIGTVTVAGGGGTAPYTYKLDNGQYQSGATFNNLAAGNYTVTVKDAAGCTRDVAVIIGQLNNTVTITVNSKTDVSCSGGSTGAVTVAGGGGTAPYEYKLGTGQYQSGGVFNALAAGDYTITVKDALGCIKELRVTIAAGSAASASITPANPDPVCVGTSQTLTASEGASFQWYRNDTLIAGATLRSYTTTDAGRYTVIITNGTCSIKSTNTVTLVFKPCVDTEIFVPKAFTPNNNNKNDKLAPRFINVKQLKYFKIYNRWGQIVFQTTVAGDGWDGTFKGVRQPMETYSWILECVDDNGNVVKKSGKTILIR